MSPRQAFLQRVKSAVAEGKLAVGQPLPLQDGGVPLWIAGGGEKKTLRIAAQYAQYTNFDGSFTQNPLSRGNSGNAYADFLLGDASGGTLTSISD